MLVHLFLKFHTGILLGSFESSETTGEGGEILSGVKHSSGYVYVRHVISEAESGNDYLTAPLLNCRNL